MFEAPRTGIGLEVEVPEPMHVFKQRVIHPDNEQLILAAQDARLLSPARLKKYRLRGQALKLALAELDYESIKSELDAIQTMYEVYRAQIHDLKLSQKDLDHLNAWVIDLEIERIKQENAGLLRNYTRLNKLVTAARTPTPPVYRWIERISPVKKLARDLSCGEMSLRGMARQLEQIRQRLSEHQEAVTQQKHREELCNEMAKEARMFAKIIQRRWAGLGFCHRYNIVRNGKSRTITNHVRFSRVEVTEDEIHLKIDVTSLGLFGETRNEMPTGVAVGRLLAPEVMDDLTVACQRQVTTPHTEDHADYVNGAWVTISRLGSTDGLMDYIPLKPVMATYKREWHEALPFPMGVKKGRVVNWLKLTNQPHLMVAGQTGAGKSNVFNVFVTTAITMHSPDEIRLILVDLKEGVGFLKYEGLPHSLGSVLTELDQLDHLLQRLEKLRKQRTEQIRVIADNIDDYNLQVSPEHRMTRIIVLCDEYQEVAAAPKELRQRIHALTHKIAAKGRNVGIHLFLGTQSPFTDMIPGKIKANITFVLSGRQRTLGASLSTFGSKIATELPKIPGRMICDDGSDVYQVQIPHVSGSDITEAIERAHTWEPPRLLLLPEVEYDPGETPLLEDTPPFTIGDVIHFALSEADGYVKASQIWQEVGKERGVGQPTITKLVKDVTGRKVIEYDGQRYQPVKKKGNFYRLEIVNEPAVEIS
jgi:hypothetical protein